MRRFWTWISAVVLAGCSGPEKVTQQELETVKRELLANDARTAAELETKLTGAAEKYATVLQLEAKVTKKLDELEKLRQELVELSKRIDGRAEEARSAALKALQFEEKLLAERLAELRALIADLKKK